MKSTKSETNERISKAASNQPFGKGCVSLFSRNQKSVTQPECTVNKPNDIIEQEGSMVADGVFSIASPVIQTKPFSISPLQRKCANCEEEKKLQRKEQNVLSGTTELHNDLIEQYRQDNGLPPHGVDPVTGEEVGPNDTEIRFGGLLDAWLLSKRQPGSGGPQTGQAIALNPGKIRSVPAPAKAPVIKSHNGIAIAACDQVADVPACLHDKYVHDTLPKAIDNIRSVHSPYSAAIAALYASALPQAQAAAAPSPPGPSAPHGISVDAVGTPGNVTFGATTHNFTKFTIELQQWPNGNNGQALSAGTSSIAFVILNEASNDALMSDLAAVEQTMVHETTHIFMEMVETDNANRSPGTPAADPNLDRTSYSTLKASLETALTPFVTQVRQLPGFGTGPLQTNLKQDVEMTAQSFLSEALARAEAGIFVKQRAGQAFTAADLRALPPFIHAGSYWSPTAPSEQEMKTFLKTNEKNIDAAILPIIYQVGELFLNLRP